MVRLKGFKERMTLSDAIDRLMKEDLIRVGTEIVSVYNACNRILAEDVIAKFDIPHFDRSAVDGYAVRAEDTFGASPNNPISLKIGGKIEIGEKPIELKRGEAIRVSTGSAIPKNANAVVMLEFTREFDGFVEIYKAVAPFENVSRRGEDFKAGEIVLRKGEVLLPQDIGVLRSLGYSNIRVLKKPVVSIIATGNELISSADEMYVGKVLNSNSPMLFCALKDFGCEPVDSGVVKDDFCELRNAILRALNFSDVVITTGGTSVGECDLVPEVVREIGKILFHGISIKPGMPTGLGIINRKPVLMLSGFPVACLIGFYTVFPEVIFKITGVKILKRRGEVVRAVLKRRIPSKAGVRTFTRVFYRDGFAEPFMTSGSGILSSMIRANGLIVVPEDVEGFEEGEEVEVILTRNLIMRLEEYQEYEYHKEVK